MKYVIKPMEEKDSKEICKWVYQSKYSVYNIKEDDENVSEFLNGEYYSAFDEEDQLVGFFCYGRSAQVPAGRTYGIYKDGSYIDIGLGMRPDLCGQGRGYAFMLEGMKFAAELFSKRKFRLTVAAFNQRAIKLYLKIGFYPVFSFPTNGGSGNIQFIVMKTV